MCRWMRATLRFMRRSIPILVLATAIGLFLASGFVGQHTTAAAQQIDTEVPPGNPVIGDDRPGDFPQADDTNYVLWGLIAVCLIGAGVLLVNIEKWEARRIEHQAPTTHV